MIDSIVLGFQWFLERLGFLFYVVFPNRHSYPSSDAVPDYFIEVIPIFFFLIVLEAVIGRVFFGKNVYRINDMISSITSGSSRLLIGMFWSVQVGRLYEYVWTNYAIYRFSYNSWTTYFGLLLFTDFGYYWLHRFTHSFHWAWVGHAAHHTGEDFNLATGLRQAGLQTAISFIFYLPLALFFPPSAYKLHSYINTISQFWFHTNLVGKLGPLEYILNTPSHHRMHHRPPGNCNYGGFLIIYDRLFGTFVPEDHKEDYYGLADNLNTFDTVWAHFFHLRRIATRVSPHPEKYSITPEWLSAACRKRANHAWIMTPTQLIVPIPPLKNEQDSWSFPIETRRRPKWSGEMKLSPSSTGWLAVNFLVTVMPLSLLINTSRSPALAVLSPWIFFCLLIMAAQGRVLDARKSLWTPFMDAIRSLLVVSFMFSLSPIEKMVGILHGQDASEEFSKLASVQPFKLLEDAQLLDVNRVLMFGGVSPGSRDLIYNLRAHQIYAVLYGFFAVFFAIRIYLDVLGPQAKYEASSKLLSRPRAQVKQA